MEEYVISSKDASASASASHLDPELVSIGPYYHGNRWLDSMEERKKNYVPDDVLRQKLPQIKSFYWELDRESKFGVKNSRRLIQMMVDDGIFILNFMHMGDKIFDETTRWKLQSDMLLHHNQLPFFVLVDLFNVMDKKLWHRSYRSVVELAITSFANLLPACFNSSAFRGAEFHDLRHLFYSCAHSLRNNLPHIDVISRIPDGILISNTSDYYPYTVSIGPYHYRQMMLEIRTDDKQSYVEKFCINRVGHSKYYLRQHLQKWWMTDISSSYRYYSKNAMKGMQEEEVMEMLVQDSCFVMELMLGKQDKEAAENNPILRHPQTLALVKLDLLLSENQLPYQVLETLFNLIRARPADCPPSLDHLAIDFFADLLTPECCNHWRKTAGSSTEGFYFHLLHLFHSCATAQPIAEQRFRFKIFFDDDPKYLPLVRYNDDFEVVKDYPKFLEYFGAVKAKSHSQGQAAKQLLIPKVNELEDFGAVKAKSHSQGQTAKQLLIPKVNELEDFGAVKAKSHSQGQEQVFIPSASDLADATTIKFKSLIDGSLFKMSFHQGTMELSPLLLTNSTICLYRNLIAFEQSLFPILKTPVTDYMIILGCLIQSARDLELLGRNNIVECAISNKQACLFFKQVDNLISSEYRQTSSSNSSLQLVSLVNNFHNVAIKRPRLGAVLLLAGLVLLLCLIAPQLKAVAPNKAVLLSVFIPILTMATIFTRKGRHLNLTMATIFTRKFLQGKGRHLNLNEETNFTHKFLLKRPHPKRPHLILDWLSLLDLLPVSRDLLVSCFFCFYGVLWSLLYYLLLLLLQYYYYYA